MRAYVEGDLASSIDELRQELAKNTALKIEVVEAKEAWALVCHGEFIGSIQRPDSGEKAERECARLLHAAVKGFHMGIEFAQRAKELGLTIAPRV